MLILYAEKHAVKCAYAHTGAISVNGNDLCGNRYENMV